MLKFWPALRFNSDRRRQLLLGGLAVFLSLVLLATLSYWGRELFFTPLPVKTEPLKYSAAAPDLSALKRLFGGGAAEQSSRSYQLTGVLADLGTQGGVALIGIDGSLARPVGQGEELLPGVTVAQIHAGFVVLSENGVMRQVMLPVQRTVSAQQMQMVP